MEEGEGHKEQVEERGKEKPRKEGRDCKDINSEISRWDHYPEPTKATKGTPRTWGRVKNEKYIYKAKLEGLVGQRKRDTKYKLNLRKSIRTYNG